VRHLTKDVAYSYTLLISNIYFLITFTDLHFVAGYEALGYNAPSPANVIRRFRGTYGSLTLNMEAICSSKTSPDFQRSKRLSPIEDKSEPRLVVVVVVVAVAVVVVVV
jgi:hypothetical protein